MDIFKMITEQITKEDTLNKLGKSVGAQPAQVEQLVKLGMPAILQAMGKNANTPDGAEALLGALTRHQDDDIEDVDQFLNKVDAGDGAKILDHVFAGNSSRVQSSLAGKVGLESSQVSGIMSQLAPLLLGAMGQQKKRQNLDSQGVAGLLGGLLSQGQNSGIMGMVTDLLDTDKDGNMMDDVGKILGGILKR